MANIKISGNAFTNIRKKIEEIGRGATVKQDMQMTGDIAVSQMKDLISKGISPIRGEGRFPGYKHAGNPKKYPLNQRRKFSDKRDRPVNLKLSGAMLSDLRATAVNNNTVKIGYSSQLSKDKEQGHRDGVHGQPSRPTIPIENERFAVSIDQAIEESLLSAVNKRINSILKKD